MPASVTTIHMPERPTNARTDTPSDSTRCRWERMQRTSQAIDAARAAGHADGVREGYRHGWRWGLACGAIAGALAVGLVWNGWLWLHAPSATPVATARPL